jgi:mismatch-specific thymine-DNA glycosylase
VGDEFIPLQVVVTILEVIFCGIKCASIPCVVVHAAHMLASPGYRSAEVGHHFANPTNHFWRCLHQSGFTPQLLSAYEDFTLPGMFSLGLVEPLYKIHS